MLAEILDLCGSLQANLVTAAAALLAFNHRHRLPVNGRHRLHGCPRQGVLSFLVLLDLCRVARRARVRSRDLDLGYVGCRGVLVSVTTHTADLDLAVLAESPVRNDIGRHLGVTADTLGSLRSLLCGKHRSGENNDEGRRETRRQSNTHELLLSNRNKGRKLQDLASSFRPSNDSASRLTSLIYAAVLHNNSERMNLW